MVLPDRIELSTSPLPMECSTTELRQHARIRRIGQNGSYRRADPCHKASARASARKARQTTKDRQNQRGWPATVFVRPVLGRSGPRIRRRSCRRRVFAHRGSGDIVFGRATHKSGSMMTDDREKGEGRAGHLAKKDARRDRLKEALRENLKRRKSQARGRNDITPAPSHDETAAPHDRGGEEPGE